MIVFIRNIGPSVAKQDIMQFVAPAIKSWIPWKSGKIYDISILTLKDLKTNTLEYHALVYVDDYHGKMIIKKLNCKKFFDRYVNVREYHTRSWRNDRRTSTSLANIPGKDYDGAIGSRVSDRRRGKNLEIIDSISAKFTAVDHARRKHL